MPSISHRASLGPGAPHRAKSGPAALPAGFAAGLARAIRRIAGWPIRWCAGRVEDWREMRQLRHLSVAEARSAIIDRRDPGAQGSKGTPR